jgi:plastocyanin
MALKPRFHSFLPLVPLLLMLCQTTFPQGVKATSTGSITGTITVRSEDRIFEEIMSARAANRYDDHMHMSADPKPYSLSEKAVVYIETVKGGEFSPPEKRARLDQQDMMFRPLVLPILVGTTVDFPNNDDLFHNVFSYSRPAEFDLGRYPKGSSKSVTFRNPGVVSVYCDIHAYMYATILVLDNPFFAVPEESGDFSISGVPPGTYRLGFWYGKTRVDSKTVNVREGETAVVNFLF